MKKSKKSQLRPMCALGREQRTRRGKEREERRGEGKRGEERRGKEERGERGDIAIVE